MKVSPIRTWEDQNNSFPNDPDIAIDGLHLGSNEETASYIESVRSLPGGTVTGGGTKITRYKSYNLGVSAENLSGKTKYILVELKELDNDGYVTKKYKIELTLAPYEKGRAWTKIGSDADTIRRLVLDNFSTGTVSGREVNWSDGDQRRFGKLLDEAFLSQPDLARLQQVRSRQNNIDEKITKTLRTVIRFILYGVIAVVGFIFIFNVAAFFRLINF